MTTTFFWRAQNNDIQKQMSDENRRQLTLNISATDLDGMLAAARKAGMPKGSSVTGCSEIQNDLGIWTRQGSKWSFISWDDLEAQEQAEQLRRIEQGGEWQELHK